MSRERRRERKEDGICIFNYRQGKLMLAELSTQKYRGCSGKIAAVFGLFISLLFFSPERKEGLFVLFLCLLRRDSTGGWGRE